MQLFKASPHPPLAFLRLKRHPQEAKLWSSESLRGKDGEIYWQGVFRRDPETHARPAVRDSLGNRKFRLQKRTAFCLSLAQTTPVTCAVRPVIESPALLSGTLCLKGDEFPGCFFTNQVGSDARACWQGFPDHQSLHESGTAPNPWSIHSGKQAACVVASLDRDASLRALAPINCPLARQARTTVNPSNEAESL